MTSLLVDYLDFTTKLHRGSSEIRLTGFKGLLAPVWHATHVRPELGYALTPRPPHLLACSSLIWRCQYEPFNSLRNLLLFFSILETMQCKHRHVGITRHRSLVAFLTLQDYSGYLRHSFPNIDRPESPS